MSGGCDRFDGNKRDIPPGMTRPIRKIEETKQVIKC